MLVIGGPAVFAGYVTDPALGGPRVSREGVVHDGWLDTGDLGMVDAGGFVYLTGRAKDLIIRGGHNIDPRVIEDGLLRHPGGPRRRGRRAAPTGTPARSRWPTSSPPTPAGSRRPNCWRGPAPPSTSPPPGRNASTR